MNPQTWQNWRVMVAVVCGAAALVAGIVRGDNAMMTVGAGLIGFAPAAKGP